MTENALSFRAVPGPGFVAGCTVSTWVCPANLRAWSPAIGYLLIGHAPPRRATETAETIEAGLMGMVDGMALRPAAERVPFVGDRLVMRGAYVALDYGHPQWMLRMPQTGAEWRAHVGAGGQVCLVVVLDPLPPGAGQDAIEAHLDRVAATGDAFMGATGIRNRLRGGGGR
ncbi:hypothetical protein ABZ804_09140 [Streptomyces sp. NPDC047726]|uniref:hypothetical protein n=1 Tax=Streptomyces sp. NPDC047726 TaxID=3156651 RepID=UPI00340C5EB6